MNENNHIISPQKTIKEALIRLNSITDQNLTLFVVNDNGQMVGTLTDGDIRRALIKNAKIDSLVSQFMQKDFHYLEKNNFNIKIFQKIRSLGIKLLPLLDDNKKIIKIYDLNKIKSVIPVDAIIMAGGKGQRLLPLTTETPKPMLPLGNKPIIEHNIDRLISFGIENIYISVNYLASKIINYFNDGSTKGIKIKYIREDKPLGTAGALRNINDYYHNNLLIMNSDLFTNINFEAFYIDHLTTMADMTIASIPYNVNIPYAIFETQGNKILSFKEKPQNTYYANAGVYLLKKELLSEIPKNEFYNITDLMEKLLKQRKKIVHSTIYGYWIDIGQHSDYERAKEIVKHLDYE